MTTARPSMVSAASGAARVALASTVPRARRLLVRPVGSLRPLVAVAAWFVLATCPMVGSTASPTMRPPKGLALATTTVSPRPTIHPKGG